jgi:hypothetical protein
VLCVPPKESPSRQATLENLGYIYARAVEVVVVLGRVTFAVLQDTIQEKVVSEQNLQLLEADQWIASVWTYQELVNAANVRFVSEYDPSTDGSNSGATAGGVQPRIGCSELLDALGHGLENCRRSGESDTFSIIKRYPNLNVLENVLVDWMLGSYTRHSALTIFSNLYYKRNDTAANYYYSILGALSDSPRQLVWPADEADETLAEKVMKICEEKGDFSFVYSVADRDPSPKQRWRPLAMTLPPDGEIVPPILRPILAWHYWGEAQSGTFNDKGELALHNMTIMLRADPPKMSDVARTAIAKWSQTPDLPSMDDVALGDFMYSRLGVIGIEAGPNPLVVSDGLVFTVDSTAHDNVLDILVSNQIRFVGGAPGLVRCLNDEGEKTYVPCLFVGSTDRLLEPGESVLL